jgi:cytochrome P450
MVPGPLDADVRDSSQVEYDPFLFYEDPYPIYKRLRDEAPVYFNQERGLWVLSRFEDVQKAGRDWHTFSSAEGVDIDEFRLGPGSFLDADPPTHGDLRKILHRDFAPKRLQLLAPEVTRTTTEFLDSMIDRGGGDLVGDFARRLPLSIVCHLFGVPTPDRARMEAWYVGMLQRTPGKTEPPEVAVTSASEMSRYILDAISDRISAPRRDLLTSIAQATADGVLSPDEADGMCRLLLLAGVHTTSSLLANTLVRFEHDAAARARLATNPDQGARAIEELLRYESPVQAGARVTTRETAVRGRTIPSGARVVLLWGSANRDERKFPNPEILDMSRPPLRHVAFGEGIHFCLGAPLARLEASIALQMFFERIPNYIITGPVERHFTFLERGLARVPFAIR